MHAGMTSANGRVCTMTLPTGTGKTLLAATWALETRERLLKENGVAPLVLIVLPFLTVIERTAREYAGLFPDAPGTGVITNYHSLSDRTFAPDLEGQSQDFFLDTWVSDVVITTFDQFLYALLSPKAKHKNALPSFSRRHRCIRQIAGSPCVLWEPLRHAARRIFQIGFKPHPGDVGYPARISTECSGADRSACKFFRHMNRYRIVLRHRTSIGLSAFVDECRRVWLENGKGST